MRENRLEKIEALKAENRKFKDEWFGEAELMPSDLYPTPPFTPTRGMHPRILVNKEGLPSLKKVLLGDESAYGGLLPTFWAFANEENFSGKFEEEGDIIPGPDGNIKNRYNQKTLAKIEAKALAYLVTGDELYGYEAIVGIKNAMLTLRYWTLTNQDTYHGAAHVLDTLVHVYDWCYALLTDTDKRQLIGGMRTKLFSLIEFKYPPTNMGAVSGHGTGLQMFRTCISLAAAFCDERPDFWQCIAGRFYSEYVPVVKYMYSSGFLPQGPSNYGAGKFYGILYSALMLRTIGDGTSYGEGIAKAPYTILANFMPDGRVMQTGDANNGVGHLENGHGVMFPDWSLLGAAITKDPTFLKYARIFFDDFNKYSYNNGRMTPAITAICIAACLDIPEGTPVKELDPITYNGHPGGQTIIRSRWDDENAAMVLMKVGDRTMANHDHQDSGNFQIYYKGLLACDSGWYTGVNYGKPHWRHYQHATVAHNCPLVYDPDAAKTSAIGKYYSGGQLYLREAALIADWHGGEFDVGRITGHAEGRSEDGKAGKYAYIAGDISNAYDKNEVAYLGRSMFTLMREGEAVPAVTLVYDDVTSINPKAIKKFLLHTPKEALLDEKTKVVTTENRGGRLTAVPLVGLEKAEVLGGIGKEFWVGENKDNGTNVDEQVPERYLGKIWGRAEFSVTGNTTDKMLTALYVSDAGSAELLDFSAINNGSVIGAAFDGSVCVFSKKRDAHATSLAFVTDGDKDSTYYVCGISSGEWRLTVNGNDMGTLVVPKGSSFVSFTAPCGEIELSLMKIAGRFKILM